MSEELIVEISDVTVSFGDVNVLDHVNLKIRKDDFLGIIGPNGGGKTTLLKVMLGLIKPQAGSVKVFGLQPHQASKLIGYVPQTTNFDHDFPISVWDVALMGRLPHRRVFQNYTKEDHQIVAEALEEVKLIDLKDRAMGRLSQGQKQRVFIARALVTQPKLLLMDEPTASVDSSIQANLYELLLNLRKDLTIVMVSHDIGVISSYVNKIACLNNQLHYHDAKEITSSDLQQVYHDCHVELIAHGIPHRVLKKH